METRTTELGTEEIKVIGQLAKRIYRALHLRGYARLDFRRSVGGRFYLLEANPNPCISSGEDFAEAMVQTGIGYGELLERMVRLGIGYRRAGGA